MMQMPFVTVLLALRDEVADALDGPTFGHVGAVKVRHGRHRMAMEEEWPCVSLIYVSSDPSDIGRQEDGSGLPEQVMEMAVDISIEMALPPEADEVGDADLDPTGYGSHGIVLACILDRLIPGDGESNTLGGTTWDIRYDGSAPDRGDAQPDAARLEERLTLFYRVRADQPTVLLMGN